MKPITCYTACHLIQESLDPNPLMMTRYIPSRYADVGRVITLADDAENIWTVSEVFDTVYCHEVD
jgi:hypothetical protein